MSRRANITTRFPSTTLFRSEKKIADAQAEVRKREEAYTRAREQAGRDAAAKADALVASHAAAGEAIQRSLDRALDRKSTRLNSSHLVISYAVFCLKKKNNPSKYIQADLNKPERSRRRQN